MFLAKNKVYMYMYAEWSKDSFQYQCLLGFDSFVQNFLLKGKSDANVIYRFSSISRSTKTIFKFQKPGSLLEVAQNIY